MLETGKKYTIYDYNLESNYGNDTAESLRWSRYAFCDMDQDGAEISFPSNIARNAGDAFYIGDDMYRPAQDCNKCYGNGINIQKVTKEGQVFSFETVSCFHSDNPDYSLGYHTLNVKNGLIVVDGHRFRYPRTVKMLQAIRRVL